MVYYLSKCVFIKAALFSIERMGEWSTKFRCVSRMTEETDSSFALADRLSKSMLPYPSSIASDCTIGVIEGPVILVPLSLICQSFILLPTFSIRASALTPASVGQ